MLDIIYNFPSSIPNWDEKIKQKQYISIAIRNKTKEYIDTITWDPLCESITPEYFAKVTSNDIDLPSDMIPVISHIIREHLFRWIISIVDISPHSYLMDDNINNNNSLLENEKKISVKTIPSQIVNNMAVNLWKRAKPNSLEETCLVAQPFLPQNKETNASVWKNDISD